MVKLHCESLPEKLLIPAFVYFFFMLYPPAWIRDTRRSTAGAAGGCVLRAPLFGFAYRLGNPLRYTRSHVVSSVSNNGYGCFADLPYLSDP